MKNEGKLSKPCIPTLEIVYDKINSALEAMQELAEGQMDSGYVGIVFQGTANFMGGKCEISEGLTVNGCEFLTDCETGALTQVNCREFGLGKARQALRTGWASVKMDDLQPDESSAQGAIVASLPKGRYALYASGYPGGYMDAIIASIGLEFLFSVKEVEQALKNYDAFRAAANH